MFHWTNVATHLCRTVLVYSNNFNRRFIPKIYVAYKLNNSRLLHNKSNMLLTSKELSNVELITWFAIVLQCTNKYIMIYNFLTNDSTELFVPWLIYLIINVSFFFSYAFVKGVCFYTRLDEQNFNLVRLKTVTKTMDVTVWDLLFAMIL